MFKRSKMHFLFLVCVMLVFLLNGAIAVEAKETKSLTLVAGISSLFSQWDKVCQQNAVKQPYEKTIVSSQQPLAADAEPVLTPILFYGYENISEERMAVVNLAISKEGIPSYSLGKKMYDLKDETQISQNEALDCSGFVQWVFINALLIDPGEGTCLIVDKTQEIAYEDLKPGDFGLLYRGGSYPITQNDGTITWFTNHIGIYVGHDENGNDLWCHCNAADNTVSVNSFDKFEYFCTMFAN